MNHQNQYYNQIKIWELSIVIVIGIIVRLLADLEKEKELNSIFGWT